MIKVIRKHHGHDILLVQLRYGKMVHQLHPQTQLFERLDGVPVTQVLRLLLRHQHEFVPQQPCSFLGIILGGRVLVDLVQVHDEALLDAKHSV